MLVLHVPHASTVIPVADRVDFCVDESALNDELLRLTDWYSDELYGKNFPDKQILRAPVSRLVVDVERFALDAEEVCAKVGMGATYTMTAGGQTLRELQPARRKELLDQYYWPHHQALDQLTGEMLALRGGCTILDAHTFPVVPLPTQIPMANPPEIGIGTDPIHTLPELRALAADFFQSRGFVVGLDLPFSGAMVPNAFYRKDTRVQSVMIEVAVISTWMR